jgi:hypothetical protein
MMVTAGSGTDTELETGLVVNVSVQMRQLGGQVSLGPVGRVEVARTKVVGEVDVQGDIGWDISVMMEDDRGVSTSLSEMMYTFFTPRDDVYSVDDELCCCKR